jgi:phage terminase large subunit
MSNGVSLIQPDGTELVLYEPTPKGLEYHERTEPNVLLYGGRGSGKSTIGRWDAHMRAMAYPGYKYCILRRTFPELETSHLVFLPKEMRALGGKWNDTKHIAVYPNGSMGFFRHCQNDKDALNLLSSEFYLMFFDEISTFEWEMFVKLAASVRVPEGSGLTAMVRAATNPLGISSEMINKYWVAKDVTPEEDSQYFPSNWYSIKANLEDNPHLDAKQYMARFSGMSAHTLKAWVDGEFSIENALFDFRPTRINAAGERKPYHVTPDIELEKILKTATIYRAIDAGWFPDPTVCLWIAHLGNRHIVFHEDQWYKTTAQDIAEDIKKTDERLGIKKVAITYCDPSMDINTTADIRTIKEIYEANGIAMENSINDRERFATAMHQALAEEAGDGVPRLQIYVNGRKGAPMLARTIPQMRFHPTQHKKMDDHRDDHWVVACCYYLMSHSADPRSSMPSSGSYLPKWMQPKKKERIRY